MCTRARPENVQHMHHICEAGRRVATSNAVLVRGHSLYSYVALRTRFLGAGTQASVLRGESQPNTFELTLTLRLVP